MGFVTKHVLWQVTDAADEVVESIDRDELAKYFSLKCDAEDDAAEVSIEFLAVFSHFPIKKKIFTSYFNNTLEQEIYTVYHFNTVYS